MDIELKLNKDFERTLNALRIKYGNDFEVLNGVDESQLDYSEFLQHFVSAGNLADTSVDPNANSSHKDIRSFMTEKSKSADKLFGLNKIFIEIKKMFGLKVAKQWLEQEFSKGFYLNDSTSASFYPYCWAQDLSRLAKEGLFFLKNYNNVPPKHLTTFLDDTIEFVSFLSNRQSGAVGLPNILIWMYWFWEKDCENGFYIKSPEYYRDQCFQKLVFRLNQPFLKIDQSAFTNMSIFDRYYIEALFGGMEFPDGSFAIDKVEEIIDFQKQFMRVVSEIRSEQMFTFPVLTISLLYKDGKFQDEEFARWASKHNMKWADSNLFISDNVGILSNCPLSGDTKIPYWSDRYNKWIVSSIDTMYHNDRGREKHFKVLSNGQEIECKINKFDVPVKYEIELTNGAKIKTSANHLNKTLRGYVESKDLTTEDFLPVSLVPYEKSDSLTYEEGKIVGMYLGNGSFLDKNGITFSMNNETGKEDIEFLRDYTAKKFGATTKEEICVSTISGEAKCSNIRIRSKYLRGLIEQFIIGENALSKEIDLKVLSCSLAFRRGILDGLYATDGGNSNRIYTASPALKDSLILLLATMGVPSTVKEDNREGRLGSNTVYTIRWYSPQNRTQFKDVYRIKDNNFWFRIKTIKEISNGSSKSYCLQVLTPNTENVFMLANGVITHNCRLLSDTTKLSAFQNSIGGTALSIGSCRVSTINLVRIAYETKCNRKRYLDLLKEKVILDCQALKAMRHILQRNIEKGLLPNYQDGAVELDKQYCTIGILGLYETMVKFGYILTDELGYKSYSDEGLEFAQEIFNVINEVKDSFECDFTFNIESIPAETCAGVMCKADNLLYNNNDFFIYSNQWIPLMEKCTIEEKCRVSSVLDILCSGGAIAHIDIENRFPTEESAWRMLNYLAEHKVIYSAFTTKINTCKHKHAFIGAEICPRCGEPVSEKYLRVVGFYTPLSSWQAVRRKEGNFRKWYTVLENDMTMQ